MLRVQVGQVQTVQLEASAPVCPHVSMTKTRRAPARVPNRWEQKGSCWLALQSSTH